MTLADLLDKYGYLAILIGTFFEGETILILGGLAAHEGFLKLQNVVLCAFIGSTIGDQLWFFLARYYARNWLKRRPALADRIGRATVMLERYPNLFILGFRFVYGIRNVAPIAIALSNISTLRFVTLNLLSAAIWASLVGGAGYIFGEAIETFVGRIKTVERNILIGLLILAAVVAVYRFVIFLYARRATAMAPVRHRQENGRQDL